MVTMHRYKNPRKSLDSLSLYKLCFCEIFIRSGKKMLRAEVEYYDSVDLKLTGGKAIYELLKLTDLK